MSASQLGAFLRAQFPNRPDTAPEFLLSRPHGSLCTSGVRATFSCVAKAAAALRNHEAPLVVGALPFDARENAALTVPETVVREPGVLDPHPSYRSGSSAQLRARASGFDPRADEHRERVAAAVSAIRAGQAEKIVLARAVDINFDEPVDPLLIAARLMSAAPRREGFVADLSPAGGRFRGCTLVGASPEVLVRKHGRSVAAYPLAGSAPRQANPTADAAVARRLRGSAKDRAEHAFVVDHLRRVLEPVCAQLEAPAAPELTNTNELWHLATPITGELAPEAQDMTALELAELVHPTPAICGTPTEAARHYITRVESPRGFYAGAVGWADAQGDGEYMVAIRCTEVSADCTRARAWAGGGIVADSVPDDELDETTAKLGTIMRALGIEL